MIRLGSTIEEVKAVLTKQYVEDKAPLVVVKQETEKDEGEGKTMSPRKICRGKERFDKLSVTSKMKCLQ